MKLAAFLHDPPGKAFDIANHYAAAESLMREAGLTDEEERDRLQERVKPADWFASSVERFVFPKGKCSTMFNGQEGSSFIHPLSSTPYLVQGNMTDQKDHLNGIISSSIGGAETEDPRILFFLYWRRWLENVASSDPRFASDLAYLPADTRIPDHTIWNHMTVTSALAGCLDEKGQLQPALLLFQLGPVQTFIAQARSTRDLWSGS